MSLSDQQIERYARQIIVPGVGGIAQERLLSSRLMLAGRATDVAPVLAYLVGAGIGELRLALPVTDAPEQDGLISRSNQLNPEVLVKPATTDPAGLNLVLALGADSETTALITSPPMIGSRVPMIFARLDEPPSIAVFPGAPPCLLCADAELLGPPKQRGDHARFVAMVAATETFKLLVNIAPASAPTLVQFSGFACVAQQLRQRPFSATCTCSARGNMVTAAR